MTFLNLFETKFSNITLSVLSVALWQWNVQQQSILFSPVHTSIKHFPSNRFIDHVTSFLEKLDQTSWKNGDGWLKWCQKENSLEIGTGPWLHLDFCYKSTKTNFPTHNLKNVMYGGIVCTQTHHMAPRCSASGSDSSGSTWSIFSIGNIHTACLNCYAPPVLCLVVMWCVRVQNVSHTWHSYHNISSSS